MILEYLKLQTWKETFRSNLGISIYNMLERLFECDFIILTISISLTSDDAFEGSTAHNERTTFEMLIPCQIQ